VLYFFLFFLKKKFDEKKNIFKIKKMARICELTGKKTARGNNRPFSLKATRREFRVNLFWRRILDPATGKMVRVRLSARAIKTLKKWARDAGVPENPAAEKAKKIEKTEKKERVKKIKLTPKQKKELAEKEKIELKKIVENSEIKKEKKIKKEDEQK